MRNLLPKFFKLAWPYLLGSVAVLSFGLLILWLPPVLAALVMVFYSLVTGLVLGWLGHELAEITGWLGRYRDKCRLARLRRMYKQGNG